MAVIASVALLLMATTVMVAQDDSTQALNKSDKLKSCSPVGTWYGGSGAKYLLTVFPNGGDRFIVYSDPAFNMQALAPVSTKWNGWLKRKGGHLEGAAMGIIIYDTSFPPDLSNLQIWAIQQTVEFKDNCDTMVNNITFFGGYYWNSNKVPLVDSPDFNVAPTPIVEVYHRFPAP